MIHPRDYGGVSFWGALIRNPSDKSQVPWMLICINWSMDRYMYIPIGKTLPIPFQNVCSSDPGTFVGQYDKAHIETKKERVI